MKCRLICVVVSFMLPMANAALADPVSFNFEAGLPAGWATFGTVDNLQVLSGLGTISPPGGHSRFAFLSNGPGARNDDGMDQAGLRSSSFLVAPGDSVSFRLAFLTAESIDEFGSPDFFTVTAIGTEPLLLASREVDGSMSEIAAGPVVGRDGTTLQYWTRFLDFGPLSLASLAGQSISLEFLVSDYWDNSFDSALLIDSVAVTNGPLPPAAVPEPSTLILSVTGAGLWLACRMWRK